MIELYRIVVSRPMRKDGHFRPYGTIVIRPVHPLSGQDLAGIPSSGWEILAEQGGSASEAVRRALQLRAAGAHDGKPHGAVLAVIAPVWRKEPAVVPPPRTPEAAPSLSLEGLVERCLAAVVSIDSGRGERSGIGAGFVVNSAGIIVTNLHVLGEATAVTVRFAGGAVRSSVWIRAFDFTRDLVVLRVNSQGLPALPLSRCDSPKLGQRVVAIGHPLGLEHSISEGIVSGERSDRAGHKMIQTTAPASRGNSGGPLLDLHGEVLGVVALQIASDQAQNLNFAIPVCHVRTLIKLNGEISLGEFVSRLRRYKERFGSTRGSLLLDSRLQS